MNEFFFREEGNYKKWSHLPPLPPPQKFEKKHKNIVKPTASGSSGGTHFWASSALNFLQGKNQTAKKKSPEQKTYKVVSREKL